ncbi:DUF4349 domain-containing protein [Methylobacterium sp. J-090]|uniref:DUF4349 domain-containing protein n=1 Tax=Methylobacterium sp. J-090 TaxID=2836666 RepID=UPI001FB8A224|nr:DUF4349 domain-containing protein [Methylobacterium sp. J-090]MCJ2080462.1 DUF4349 domain-containing protein [Methylobacterium sp. J-090]
MAGRRSFVAATLGLAALLGIGGCSDARPPAPEAASPLPLVQAQRSVTAKLAFTHDLTIGLPPDRVAAHFTAARDRCASDTGLGCVLVSSSIDDGPRPLGRPQAHLQVRLPHVSVSAYVAFLTAPLPGETAGDVVLRRQATRADDLTTPIEDGERRLAQLAAYRGRLDELAAKPDTRVEDLIRIAGELSQVQSQIEATEARQRGLQQRVDTEIVSVSFRSDGARAGAFAPVEEAWSQAGRTFGASAGDALRFAVASLPWLPVAAIGLLLVRVLWRLRRRRRARIGRPLTEAQP